MDKDAFSVRFGTRKAVRNRTLLEKCVRNYEEKLQVQSVTGIIIAIEEISTKYFLLIICHNLPVTSTDKLQLVVLIK